MRTQIVGLFLAIWTAAGCLAYERLVKSCSYSTVGFLVSLSYMPFWLGSYWLQGTVPDSSPAILLKHKWSVAIFLLSGATGPLWYYVTREKNVIAGAIFEVKYVFLLGLFSVFAGTTEFRWTTAVAILCAIGSIYFISK